MDPDSAPTAAHTAPLDPALTAALEATLGSGVARASSVSGGDINSAYQVELRDGRRLFVKTHARLSARVFQAEARGLEWLGSAGALRVPEVVAVANEEQRPAFLALEWLEPGRRRKDFDEALGRGLAALHREHPPTFGLDHDNVIGSLPQHNAPCPTWAEFYRERRLLPQVERATRARRLPPNVERGLRDVASRLEALVGADEPPSKLHGDLWSGNLHTGPLGEPCLIDPACYAGHREVDLAMMRLFGGFAERVFAAYAEAFPLAYGHRERVPLYQLYPLLVHVNLFGGSYVGSLQGALSELS